MRNGGKRSDFGLRRATCLDGRVVYYVVRRKNAFTGVESCVWSGMRNGAREALAHARELERYYGQRA